jgi:hypothetical protein
VDFFPGTNLVRRPLPRHRTVPTPPLGGWYWYDGTGFREWRYAMTAEAHIWWDDDRRLLVVGPFHTGQRRLGRLACDAGASEASWRNASLADRLRVLHQMAIKFMVAGHEPKHVILELAKIRQFAALGGQTFPMCRAITEAIEGEVRDDCDASAGATCDEPGRLTLPSRLHPRHRGLPGAWVPLVSPAGAASRAPGGGAPPQGTVGRGRGKLICWERARPKGKNNTRARARARHGVLFKRQRRASAAFKGKRQ